MDSERIKIDDDWKNEARSEAEAQTEAIQRKAQAKREAQQLPEAGFTSLVTELATRASLALGLMQMPGDTKAPKLDLPHAQYVIDTLAMLQQKTAGNLEPDEAALLDDALYQLRMAFVSVSQKGPPRPQAGPAPRKLASP